MEVIKRKDGERYRDKVYIDGKPKVSPCFRRKSDCKNWKRNQILERDRLRALGISQIPEISIKDFSLIFLRNKTVLSKRTYKSYNDVIKNYIVKYFGKRLLSSIRLQDGENLKLELIKDARLSVTRINNIVRYFKIFMNEAVKANFLHKSPFLQLKLIPSQNKELNYWLPHEIKKFLDSVKDNHFYELYLVALTLGLRKGEILGLMWDCINLDKRSITIKRAMTENGLEEYVKGKKIRYLPLNDSMLIVFQKLRNKAKRLDFVFTNQNGGKICYHHFTDREFNKSVRKAGVKKIRFHELRTTFASNFMMNGGDVFVLSKWLGHSSVTITESSYAHLHNSYLEKQKDIVNFDSNSNSLKVVK